jgi:hypothetical protein
MTRGFLVRLLMGLTLVGLTPHAGHAAGGEGDWQSHNSAERCAVSGMATGEVARFLMLEGEPGGGLRLVIAAKEMPRWPKGLGGSQAFPAEIVSEAKTAVAVTGFPRRLSGELPNAVTLSSLTLGDAIALAEAPAFSVRFKGGSIGPLASGGMRAGVRAIHACIAERLIALGADPAQFEPGGMPAVPLSDPERWLSNSQVYEMARAAGGINVNLRFKVAIDPQGKVGSCALLSESNAAKLEVLGCKSLFGRVLAKPATDKQGRPVVGVLTFPVMVFRN